MLAVSSAAAAMVADCNNFCVAVGAYLCTLQHDGADGAAAREPRIGRKVSLLDHNLLVAQGTVEHTSTLWLLRVFTRSGASNPCVHLPTEPVCSHHQQGQFSRRMGSLYGKREVCEVCESSQVSGLAPSALAKPLIRVREGLLY